ncbi:MAG: phage portal protein [Dehalococcoidales bacterium]|nr:phage portal protein [Dehalococcoidales bacterium]
MINLFSQRQTVVGDMLRSQAAYEEIQRANRMNLAWRAYYGQMPKPLKSTRSDPQAKDNVLLNFARVIVDKGVSFLFGQDLDFEITTDGEETSEDSPEEKYLDEVWDANHRMTTLQKLALNGAVCGHTFLKLLDRRARGLPPRIVVLDPATVTPTHDPDDIENVTAYRIQYPAIDAATGKPITVRQLIEQDGTRWHITDQRSEPDSNTWVTIGEAVWPYSWSPVHDCQNLPAPNAYWGIADLEDDVLAVNNAINFAVSNLARILRIHAHPKTWGSGFSADKLDISADETIILPSNNSKLANLEMLSDLSSSIEFYKRLKDALHEVSRVPEVATGKLDAAGNISGVALQILYGPLVEKTETKRRLYGDMLTDLNQHLLEMGGFGADHKVLNKWPELLPGDPLGEAQTLLLHEQLGVASKETIAAKLGYDWQSEQAKMDAEDSQMGDKLLAGFDKGQGAVARAGVAPGSGQPPAAGNGGTPADQMMM